MDYTAAERDEGISLREKATLYYEKYRHHIVNLKIIKIRMFKQ
jgi:hypothetical protein